MQACLWTWVQQSLTECFLFHFSYLLAGKSWVLFQYLVLLLQAASFSSDTHFALSHLRPQWPALGPCWYNAQLEWDYVGCPQNSRGRRGFVKVIGRCPCQPTCVKHVHSIVVGSGVYWIYLETGNTYSFLLTGGVLKRIFNVSYQTRLEAMTPLLLTSMACSTMDVPSLAPNLCFMSGSHQLWLRLQVLQC